MARKFLTPINLNQNELQNARMQNLASAPSSPVTGQVYYDTTLNQFGTYNGTSWVYLTGEAGTGDVTKASNAAASNTLQVSGGTDKSIADYAPGSAGIVKTTSAGIPGLAVAGTDYLAPSGSGAALTGITESQVSNLTTDLAAKAPLASPTFTGHVTVPTPTSTTDAVTKAYADAISSGLNVHAAVVVVSTTNQATLSGLLTIDGVTLTAGQRVLLVGQTTASQNGLWVAGSSAWTRPTDFASGTTQNGTYVFVESGTQGTGAGYIMTGAGSVTVDTTSQTWTQFSGAGEVTAGTGLTMSGNTLSLATLTGKYAATIGDGSTTAIAVTHSLGTRDLTVAVYDASAYTLVECDVTFTSTTVATFTFATAPASNAYRVVLIG